MKEMLTASARTKIKILGFWQLTFALITIGFILNAIFENVAYYSALQLTLMFTLLLLPAYGVLCAIACLRLNRHGLLLSEIYQWIQVPAFITAPLTWMVQLGIGFTAGLQLGESVTVSMNLNALPQEQVGFAQEQPEASLLAVNLVAVGIIIWLRHQSKSLKKASADRLLESLTEPEPVEAEANAVV